MTLSFNSNTENKETWLTPPHIIKALGVFDLDPCASINMPWETALKHYNRLDDGLKQKWQGRVWCNPPYGRQTFEWIRKLAKHGNGIALIFARTETKGFHDQIWNKADSMFFFEGRIRFHRHDGTLADSANAASCLVAYGLNNTKTIEKSGLKGKHVYLRTESLPHELAGKGF